MQPALSYLENLARQAGTILRAGYNKEHQVGYKGVIDLVTEVDHQSEAYLLGEVRRDFPDHHIFSEESGVIQGNDEHIWYIDPLDGTVNYAHHVPIFCVSIGYAYQGRLTLGAVYDPLRDEMFTAERGQIAGVKGVVVTIFPFKYNPSEDKLVIINSDSIAILLNQAILPVMDKSSAFNQYLRSVFVNYEWASARTSSKYLIITAPTFETGMQQFVTHKVSKGFQVDMFNTNVTGTTTTAIKSFIQQRYNDPSTKPEYIVLVGDVAQIPAWTGTVEGSQKTDINYAQLEGGDYFADAFLGRFSISTLAELQK